MLRRFEQLIKYGFWGIVSTAVNLVLFYAFLKIHIPYVAANIVSYILAVIASYYFNSKFVFDEAKGESRETIKKIKYYLMRGISVLVDSGLLVFLHEVFGLNLMLSKIIDSIIIIGTTYVLSKLWIFKDCR